MVEWGLQDKPKKTVGWGLDDSPVAVLSPAEEEQEIKETLDLSEEYDIPVDDSQRFVAGPEPGLFRTQLGRIREFIRERTGFFEPPIYGKKFREEQPFRTAGKAAAFYGAETISGLSLTALDVLTNKTVGDKTLAEAVARVTGFEPTSEERQAGEAAKFISTLTPVGIGVRAGVGVIPAAQSLKTILGSGLTFATTDAAIQFSKNITEGKPVDWSRVHAAGGVGVLWGAGEVAVAATVSKIIKGMDKFWGEKGMDVAEKLRPPGTSLKDQYTRQQVEIRADINRAKDTFRKTGKMPEDLMQKYVHGKPPKGSAMAPPEVEVSPKGAIAKPVVKVPAKPIAKPPITKAIKPPEPAVEPPKAKEPTITPPKGQAAKGELVREVIKSDVTQGVRYAAVDKEGNEIGAAIVNPDSTPPIIEDIQVPEEIRRQGIGTAIVDAIKEEYPDIRTSLRTQEGDEFFKKVLTPAKPTAGEGGVVKPDTREPRKKQSDVETFVQPYTAMQKEGGKWTVVRSTRGGRVNRISETFGEYGSQAEAWVEAQERMKQENPDVPGEVLELINTYGIISQKAENLKLDIEFYKQGKFGSNKIRDIIDGALEQARKDTITVQDLRETQRNLRQAILEYYEQHPDAPAPTTRLTPQAKAEAKQPWEMTKAEWESEIQPAHGMARRLRDTYITEEIDNLQAKYDEARKAQIPWKIKEYGKQLSDAKVARLAELRDQHEAGIRSAVKAGKPVPPEVLAEYPDLAKAKPVEKKRDILGGVDPITQINKALVDAVEIRPKVEAERKVELRKRVGAAAGALKSSLKKRKISAEEAIGKSTGLLKGPLSDARFESIRDVIEDAQPGAINEAFRSIGNNEKLSYFEIVETKNAFSSLIDGIPITLRQVEMIKKQFGIEMGEIAKQRAEVSSLSDRLWNLWRAGLLTGLKTFGPTGINTTSNLTHGVTETLADAIAAPVDILISKLTGQKREIGFTFGGMPKGVKEGAKKGWEYLKTGISERDIGKKFDFVPINYGNSKLGKASQIYVETVFHIMGATDQPFYYGAMSRSIKSQSIAQGRNEGLKGQELKEFVEKKRLTPSGEMLENATHDAEMAVFQNRTVLGDIASKIQKAPVFRWVVPFSRTPSAVAMQIINYTPVGTMKEVVEQIHKGEFNKRLFSKAIGRSVVGTPALAIGALLVAKGLMTLDYPDGERERKLWELEGKKPFAIKIGDKWRSAYVLGPAGNVLLIGGYFQKAFTESGSPSEAIVTAMAGGGKSLTEQTFVIGMSRAIDAIKDPERSFDRFFSGMAGSFVPTIVADVARATDYAERTYKGPWQGVVNRVPGARTTLEERVDVFGQDLPRYGGNPLEVMIDASRPVKIRQDVVVDEIRRLWDKGVRVAPTQLGNRDGYDILTQEENTVLWRRAGEATYQALFELIKKRSYLRKDDEGKGKLIEKEVKEAKDNARAEIAEIKINQGLTMEELKEDGLVTSDVEPLIRRRR